MRRCTDNHPLRGLFANARPRLFTSTETLLTLKCLALHNVVPYTSSTRAIRPGIFPIKRGLVMRTPSSAFVMLLLGVLLTACDSSSSTEMLRLFTEVEAYAADATVAITLANVGDRDVEVHPELCGIIPQVRGESGWDAAPPYDRLDFLCTAAATTLRPGGRIEVTFSLTELDAPAGTHRFTFSTSAGPVFSNTFSVTS